MISAILKEYLSNHSLIEIVGEGGSGKSVLGYVKATL